MLTQAEMTDARDQLRQAEGIISRVRVLFLSAGNIQGARLLQDAINLVSDEIAALDRAIGAAKP